MNILDWNATLNGNTPHCIFATPCLDCKLGATEIVNFDQLFKAILELCEEDSFWDVEDLGRFLSQMSLQYPEYIGLSSSSDNKVTEYEDRNIKITGSIPESTRTNPMYYEFPKQTTVDSFNNAASFQGVILAPQHNSNIRTPDIYPKLHEYSVVENDTIHSMPSLMK